MYKTVILVGGYSRKDIAMTFSECCSTLNKNQIPIIRGCLVRRYIETKRCIIYFLVTCDIASLRGVRGDIGFYIPDGMKRYIRCNRSTDDYSKSFIDYICKIEGIKE